MGNGVLRVLGVILALFVLATVGYQIYAGNNIHRCSVARLCHRHLLGWHTERSV